MLEYHQALDTFVGDELIRKANCSQDVEKHLQLPTSSGGHSINVPIVSSEHGEPPSKQCKMDFSHIFQLKSTGSCMSNKQLKAITQVVRKVGIICPSISVYYKE